MTIFIRNSIDRFIIVKKFIERFRRTTVKLPEGVGWCTLDLKRYGCW